MAMEIFTVGRGQEGYPERLMPFADMRPAFSCGARCRRMSRKQRRLWRADMYGVRKEPGGLFSRRCWRQTAWR